MSAAILIVNILLFMAIIVGIYFGISAAISAAGDAGFFIKKPVPGRFTIILKGGIVHKIIYSIKGWVLDETTGEMVRGNRRETWWEKKFGAWWIGNFFIFRVYTFSFSGRELKTDPGNANASVMPFDLHNVETLFFQHTYTTSVENAETSGNIPLNLKDMNLLVRRTNPEKCFFAFGTPQQGLDTVLGLVRGKTKDVVQSLDIDEVLGFGNKTEEDDSLDLDDETKEEVKRTIILAILKLNEEASLTSESGERLSGSLLELTGYEIITVAIEDVEPAVSEEELKTLRAAALAEKAREAALIEADAAAQVAVIEAEGNATAIVIGAKADKQADILRGEGKAGALAAEAKAMARTKHGRDLRGLQALEKSQLVTPGGDSISLLVQPEKKKESPIVLP